MRRQRRASRSARISWGSDVEQKQLPRTEILHPRGEETIGDTSDWIDVSDAREIVVHLDVQATTPAMQFTARIQTMGNLTDQKQFDLPYDFKRILDVAGVDTAAKSDSNKRNLVTQTDVVQRVVAVYKRVAADKVRLNWLANAAVTFRASMTLK